MARLSKVTPSFCVMMEAPPAKKARIHFGSLEVQEKKNIRNAPGGESKEIGVSAAVRAGIEAGNINIDTGGCALFRQYSRSINFVS